MAIKINKPVTNTDQNFNETEKEQARENIDAIGNTEYQQLLAEIELLKNKGLFVVDTQIRFG